MEDMDYAAIGQRIEDISAGPDDVAAVMALLGCERREKEGMPAYRLPGGGEWSAAPRLDSADDFEAWVLMSRDGEVNDMGRNEDGSFYAGYQDDEHGNDYGNSRRIGAAMWSAFVHLVGKVERT